MSCFVIEYISQCLLASPTAGRQTPPQQIKCRRNIRTTQITPVQFGHSDANQTMTSCQEVTKLDQARPHNPRSRLGTPKLGPADASLSSCLQPRITIYLPKASPTDAPDILNSHHLPAGQPPCVCTTVAQNRWPEPDLQPDHCETCHIVKEHTGTAQWGSTLLSPGQRHRTPTTAGYGRAVGWIPFAGVPLLAGTVGSALALVWEGGTRQALWQVNAVSRQSQREQTQLSTCIHRSHLRGVWGCLVQTLQDVCVTEPTDPCMAG